MGAWDTITDAAGSAWDATLGRIGTTGTITTEDPETSEKNIEAKCGTKPAKPVGYDKWVALGRPGPSDTRDPSTLVGE